MKRSIAALALAGPLVLAGTSYFAYAQGITFLKGQMPGEVAIVRMAGTSVFNSKADVIGTIGDVVVGADGKATAAVINVGGFLGVGSKVVAVPFSALKIGPVVEGSRVLLLDVTKEQLQAAPNYVATDPSRTDRAKKKASEWLKIAKDKAVELGKQASDAIQEMRDKSQTPAPSTPSTSAPAPKQ
jgi:sporulation protein YlmC with PRC-barrel domain